MRRMTAWREVGPWSRFLWGNRLKVMFLALGILGAKWCWIAGFAGEVPYMDQWDAEAVGIYAPLQRGEFSWDLLFDSHNEHRIVVTRLLAAALFLACGRQWDPVVQVMANALVHALFLAAVAAWCARRISPRWHPAVFSLVAALGGLPFSWENMFWGFQSQVYFALLFGWIGGMLLLHHRPDSWRWWVGLPAGLLAVLSFSAGVFFGIALAGTAALRLLRRDQRQVANGMCVLAGLLIVTAAMAIRVDVPGHAHLRADSWGSFSWVAVRLMGWPDVAGFLGGVFLWLPWFLLMMRVVAGTQRVGRLGEGAVFVGLVAAGQIGVLALYRAGEVIARGVPSRYTDFLVLTLIAGLWSALALGCRRGKWSGRYRAALLGWIAIALLGLGREGWLAIERGVVPWRQLAAMRRDHLRAFLNEDDATVLAGRDPQVTGHPDANHLAAILRDADIRPVLPPALGDGLVSIEFWEGTFVRSDMPADFHPPPGLRVHGGFIPRNDSGERRAISQPFELRRGHFDMSLALSAHPGVAEFEFVPVGGGSGAAFVARSSRRPGGEWLDVRVSVTPGDYVLRVRDGREEGWVAFSAPREMSALGAAARGIGSRAYWLIAVGWIGLVLSFARPDGGPSRLSRSLTT